VLQSRAEIQPRRRRGQQQPIRHDLLHGIDEGLAAGVHGYDHVRLERLQLGDDLIRIVGPCRPEMEAADQRMQLLDAGDLLRLPDCVENADAAARGDDH
jgi:hypothetical protein